VKAGLSYLPHDEKTLRKDPSLEYVKSPQVKSYTDLMEKRLNEK